MNELTDIRAVRQLLDRHGFHFSKALGQNFLINPSVCPRMAEACGADKTAGVIEIGPGIGVLTRELAKVAGKVASIELDRRLFPVLEETLAGCDNVALVEGDALALDLEKLIDEQFTRPDGSRMPVYVCANLPYYITSPVLMRLLEGRLPLEGITVLVQKEAAVRLCAQPGTRQSGAVTLAVRYYARPEMLFGVSRGSFLPAPQVDSAVMRLTLRKDPPVDCADPAGMFRLIRAAFNQRRKTMANSLTGAGLTKEQAAAALQAAGLPLTRRAEQCTLEDFARLSEAVASFDK
ncbi:MAG: 16S rRNA (adenine(1518)-N(6)/adenine(1519)-N(6))-dimethyltransferase RsmA [Acutalibacteraceae bacterium]|jgi:16S rRNA (adenine1518-N6/adenine1519-N6)-dimethyltransferase